MMNIKTKIALIFLCAAQLTTFSQNQYKPIDSKAILKEGIKLHDNEKYSEAISEFKKIKRNDSLFAEASYELINTYIADNKDSLAVILCDELLKLSDESTPDILVFKGNALDNLKKLKEAEIVYLDGAKKYPLNNRFYYELGVSKFKSEKYSEAYNCFLKSIKINPFHAGSHMQLGNLALKQGKVVPAMLAWQYFLVLENNTKRAGNVVNDLEALAKLEIKEEKLIEIPEIKDQNDFSDLESVFRSKISLSQKYKSKTNLNYDLVKQIQLLCENIGKYSDVKGFYNDFYGKFFAEVWSSKRFEPYVYAAFSGLNNEKITKWVSKNKKDIESYYDWHYNDNCIKHATFDEKLNGNVKQVPHWYSQNKLYGAGEKNSKQQKNGYWNFYFDNGIRKSEGAFINDLKEGKWIFYFENGFINNEITYKNGEQIEYKEYFENSNPKYDYKLTNKLVEGKTKVYYSNGNISVIYDYKNGKISGTEDRYFRNGAKKYTIQNNDGTISGDLIEYYDNGKIYQKCKFVEGNREGQYYEYFNNPKNSISEQGLYAKGKAVGAWKMYYKNESLYQEGSFNKNGEREGLWKYYHTNGKLSSEIQYSEGKYNGVAKYYTIEGKLWEEMTYKKDKITEIKSYKETGEILAEHKLSGRSNVITLYYPNGKKQKEGLYKNGESEGLWKSYNISGGLTLEANYVDGKLDGEYKTYYSSGAKNVVTNYKAGKENSYYKKYHMNGKIEKEGYIVDDNEFGTWKIYYKDGTLEEEKYFNEGDLQGWYVSYDPKGKINNENYYKLGCITRIINYDTLGNITHNFELPGGNGEINQLYKNGKLAFYRKFKADYPSGKSTTFYPDGTPLYTGTYEGGRKTGIQTSNDELGKLTKESVYFNGKLNGKITDYHYNGKIESEYSYIDDNLNGEGYINYESGKLYRKSYFEFGDQQKESFTYDQLGELIYIRKYEDDELIGYSYYDATGKAIPFKKIESGQQKITCYFKNGKKSIEVNYTDGDLNGKRTTYTSNGNISETEDFIFNEQHGEARSYYPNGTLRSIENYNYGDSHGVHKFYYENGKIRKECTYVNNNLHGPCKLYNEAGVLIKTVYYVSGFPVN